MRRAFIFYLLAVTVLLNANACSDKTTGIEAFTKEIYTPSYALGFKITGADKIKSTILSVTNPWQGSKNIGKNLFIIRDNEAVPEGFQGQVVHAGAKRIVCMSSTHVAMLSSLGEEKRVIGVSGKDYISNEYIIQNKDSIGDVGYDGNLNYERLVSLNPDIVFIYGVNAASSMETKLEELNIPYTYIGEYLEDSPLGKAEWMVAIAEILDTSAEGKVVFNAIPQRYNQLKSLVKHITHRPTVMLNTPYGDNWFMPSEQSYQIQLIKDAGADFIYKKNTGNASAPIDMEEAYLLASQADFWLNLGSTNTIEDLTRQLPKFSDISSLKEGRVYNNTKRTGATGGNDYWESGVVNPDIILRDLILIFHPNAIQENTELYYYQKVD